MNILHINSNYLTSKLHENLLDSINYENITHSVYMPMKAQKIKDLKYKSKYKVVNPVIFNNFDRYIFSLKQLKIINFIPKKFNPQYYDLFHAHTLFTDGNVAYTLKKRYSIPYIVTVRGDTDIENFFKYRINLRSMGIKILKNASKICFLSPAHRQKLLDLYIHQENLKQYIMDHSIILPNGIDTFWFKNEYTAKRNFTSGKINVVSVGTVNARKNQLTTIEAIKLFEKKYNKKICLTMIGKVTDKRYAAKVKEKLDDNITLLNPVDKSKLLEIYRNNHLMLLPSHQETFGLVYPEAMSQGLPVIYSKGQGFDGFFEDGYVGYGVSPNSPQDMADKINKIMNRYDHFSANAIDEYRRFNWSDISNELVNIYLNSISERKLYWQ